MHTDTVTGKALTVSATYRKYAPLPFKLNFPCQNLILFQAELCLKKGIRLNMNSNEPLAFRMRPKTLEEYVGQEHVLGKDKLLYRTIKADRLSSIILWGPTGSRKNLTCKSN